MSRIGRWRDVSWSSVADSGLRITGHLCAVGFRQAANFGIDNLEHGLIVDTEFYSGTGGARRGLSWLHRWMLAKGLTMQPEPAEPAFVRELFNAVQR
jgi:hypothetical protein